MSAAIQTARAIIARHGEQLYHAIAPSDRLLDLERLSAHLGKALEVVRAEPLEAVAAKPGAYDAPFKAMVLIDRALLGADALTFRNEAGETETVTAADFRRLGKDAALLDFSASLGPPSTAADRGGDLAAIAASLSRFTTRRMRARLDETLSIPPLPEAARRIIALRANRNYEARELIRIVEADPSLASRLLGWANSALYNVREPVASIDDAITRVLGHEAVLNMALAIAIKEQLNVPAAHVRGLSPYWLEAMYSAATTEALANLLPRRRPALVEPGLAYLAGLLSNFGTLVIGHVFPPFYARICRLQDANRHLPHTHVDQHALGIAREAFAAALLDAWRVPTPIVDAVRFQHAEYRIGPNHSYVALLRLAHRLLAAHGLSDAPVVPIDDALADDLALSAGSIDDVMKLIEDSADELDGMAQALSA